MQNQIATRATEKVVNNTSIPLTDNEMGLFLSLLRQNSTGITSEDINSITTTIKDLKDDIKTAITDAMLMYKQKSDRIILELGTIKKAMDENTKVFSDENTINRKQVAAVQNKIEKKLDLIRNPLLYSTKNKNEEALWKDKISGDIALFCLKNNRRRDTMYGKLFSGLEEMGYKVNDLATKTGYANSEDMEDSILTMCSHSDTLRLAINIQLDKILGKTSHKAKASKAKVSYKEYSSCPDEVWNLVSKVSHGTRPSGQTFKKVKTTLFNRLNITEEVLIKNTKKKYNLPNCNVWFAISKNPELMEALKVIVSEKEV